MPRTQTWGCGLPTAGFLGALAVGFFTGFANTWPIIVLALAGTFLIDRNRGTSVGRDPPPRSTSGRARELRDRYRIEVEVLGADVSTRTGVEALIEAVGDREIGVLVTMPRLAGMPCPPTPMCAWAIPLGLVGYLSSLRRALGRRSHVSCSAARLLHGPTSSGNLRARISHAHVSA